ncbi:MAG: hypothetical protein ACYSWO_06145 [Planctomycetota bacterium]
MGIRKVRFVGVEAQASVAVKPEKPADKSEPDAGEVVADTEAAYEPSEEWAEEPYEEPKEEFAAEPQRHRGGNAEMVVVGSQRSGAMSERFQEERARRELAAKRAKTDEENLRRVKEAWPNLDELTREKIQGIMEKWPHMSEEERDYHRAGNIE